MRITYDKATDTLTIVLRDTPARMSEEEKSGVILDYDAADRLIAIEILVPRAGSIGSTPYSCR